jgi:hypothetical protein
MLEEYYNDDLWKKYISLYSSFWNNTDYQLKLLDDLNNNIDLAMVIYGIFEDDSHIWINKKIPALGKELSPVNCLEKDYLLKRLKTLLTRISR